MKQWLGSLAAVAAALVAMIEVPARAQSAPECTLTLPAAPNNRISANVSLRSSLTAPGRFLITVGETPTPPIPAGIYPGWCIDAGYQIPSIGFPGPVYAGGLYSSQDPNLNSFLPPHPNVQVGATVWKKVNWILNNRATCDLTPIYNPDVQAAIWNLVGGPVPVDYHGWVETSVQCLLDGADAAVAGGWEVGCSDKTAVIFNPDQNTNVGEVDDVQLLILEVPCPCGQIGNYVWYDDNGNGIQDEAASRGVNGVTTRLLDCDGNPVLGTDGLPRVTVTANNGSNPGYYLFDHLYAGCYRVQFDTTTIPAGYSLTQVGAGTEATDSDPDRVTGLTPDINLPQGGSDLDQDAGLVQLGSIGNYVWDDSASAPYADGLQNNGASSGVNGVQVQLRDCANNLITSTTTANDGLGNPGYYLFPNLLPGCYRVQFILPPSGFTGFTAANAGDDTQDSDADVSTGFSHDIDLGPGENDLTIDAGLVRPAAIGDRVWLDNNANGVQDGGENGVGSVQIELYRCEDPINPFRTMTTGSGVGDIGLYRFTDLPPGQYFVKVSPVSGYIFTSQSAANPDGISADSDVAADGRMACTTLEPGETDLTWDGGLIVPAPAVTVDKTASEAVVGVGELVTYTYVVKNTGNVPLGVTPVVDDNGTPDFTGDDVTVGIIPGLSVGQQVSLTYTTTLPLTLCMATETGSIPAGVLKAEPLSNGNVKVTYRLPRALVDNTFGANAAGYTHSLNDLILGDAVRLRFQDGVGATVLDIKVDYLSASGAFGSGYGSLGVSGGDGAVLSGSAAHVVSATSTLSKNLNQAPAFYGFTTDSPAPELSNPLWDYEVGYEVEIAAAAFGANGFGGVVVPAADHSPSKVGLDRTFPKACDANCVINTVKAVASTQYVPGGLTVTDTAQVCVEETELASIGDRVWYDVDRDGIQDAGEAGVDGVTATLYRADNSPVGSQQTSGGGYYYFTVPPGQYYVVFTGLPSGYVFSPSTAGGASDPTDSDANPSNGRTDLTTLVNGENDLTWDAGIHIPETGPCVEDLFSFTTDGGSTSTAAGNVRTYTTPGGVKVKVTAFSREKTTGAWATAFLGRYSGGLGVIDGSESGSGDTHTVDNNSARDNYVLFEFSVPVVIDRAYLGYVSGDSDLKAWIGTFTDPFNNHLTLSDATLSSFGFTESNMGAGSVRWADLNAGEVVGNALVVSALVGESNDYFKINNLDICVPASQTQNASIGNRVWNDLNKNGVQDTGESGVDGVTVQLFRCVDNSLVGTMTTSGGGIYGFNVPPGDYYVKFSNLPAGYVFSPSTAGTASDPVDSDANPSTGRTDCTTLVSGENDDSWDAGIYQTTSGGCTLTIGYWKNHPEDIVVSTANPIYLGTQGGAKTLVVDSVTKALNVLSQSYYGTSANGITKLYAQLLAAKLNIRSSANPTAVSTAIAQADAFLAIYRWSDWSSLTSAQKTSVNSWHSTFDQYNNGIIGPGHCDGQEPVDAKIGNRVWNDANNNGVQDTGETGVDGVTVKLFRCSDNSVAGTASTAGGGLYLFTVAPGDYYVEFSNLPAGYSFSPADSASATEATDSDANAVTGRAACTSLSVGELDETWDAGIYKPVAPPSECVTSEFVFSGSSAVSGTVGNIRTFTAANGVSVKASAFSRTSSGSWAPAYLGLYGGGLGVTDSGEGDGSGDTHTVDNLDRQNYVLLEFSEPVVLDGAYLGYVVGDSDLQAWIGTFSNPFVNHLTLSDAVVSAFGFNEVNATTSGSPRWADLNAGLVLGNAVIIAADTTDTTPEDRFKLNKIAFCKPSTAPVADATIGNRVWADSDRDGVQDTGENGVDGVTVRLYRCSDNSLVGTKTTSGGGLYSFTVAPGDYYVKFSNLPANHVFSPSTSSAVSDPSDSDANPSTGVTACTTLVSGENDASWDAGIHIPSSVCQTPGGVVATPGDCRVKLSWNSCTGATGYKVKRCNTQNGTYSVVCTVGTVTTCDDTSVSNDCTYYYKVQAVYGSATSDDCAPVSATPTAPVPSPWKSQDIGAVAAAGSSTYASASGTFTLGGSGADIWGATDEFRYVYQTAVGACTVVAKVTGLSNTNPWAKVGVMIRESLSANSEHASVFVTPSNGVAFQWRDTTGGISENINQTGFSAPYWVKITRSSDNVFRAFRSANGSTWTKIGEATIPMSSGCYIGLAVTSHADGTVCTATMNSVSATP